MATKRTETAHARKRRAFASGFLDGLAAPAMLFYGYFEMPNLNVRRSTARDSWMRTGAYIRRASEQYRRNTTKHG